MESDETDTGRPTFIHWLGSVLSSNNAAEPDAVARLARTYYVWTAIIGGFFLLILAINSGAMRSSTPIWTAAAAVVVGFVPVLSVAHGLRHGLGWGRAAAFALPVFQVGFAALLAGGAGPLHSQSAIRQFVSGLAVVQEYQCPVTAVLALLVWWRSRRAPPITR
jgi:hypothetical protein